MKRRQFIALLGGAAAWPLSARAQQPALPVVGFLSNRGFSADFRRGLEDAGYVVGRNVTITLRSGTNRPMLLQGAIELVQLRAAVIVADGALVVLDAATTATSTIPIVYMGGADPVRLGFAASLSHPGGNVTGITLLLNDLVGKSLDLISLLVPEVTTFGYLIGDRKLGELDQLVEGARVIGREIIVLECHTVSDLENAFRTLTARGAGALLVSAFPLALRNQMRLLRLVADHRLPAIYAQPGYVSEGGLMSYSYRPAGLQRQLATQYVARILKGEKPSDLPIQQPTKFQLTINLKTAKALGLTVPDTLLALGDEVIE
jgi:putative ABC transport system substrate-binding protein